MDQTKEQHAAETAPSAQTTHEGANVLPTLCEITGECDGCGRCKQ